MAEDLIRLKKSIANIKKVMTRSETETDKKRKARGKKKKV